MVEECIENIDGHEMIYRSTLKNHKNVCGSCECKSCTVCIVLFVIAFLIIISISSAFVYFYWCSKKKIFMLNLIPVLKQQFHWNKNGGNIKEINIKNRTYYFFNQMINIEDLLKIFKNLRLIKNRYKTIGYITIKKYDFENINSVNALHLMTHRVIGHIQEKNDSKYITFSPDNKLIDKYEVVWKGIKNETEAVNNDKKFEYSKDFMKIKFVWDDDFPWKKQLKSSTMTAVVRYVFEEDGKFYPQFF